MEDKLYINYEELHSDGETLVKESTNINSNIDGINDILDKSIEESWIGEDSIAYINKLKQVCISLYKYSYEVNNVGEYLKNISVDYQDTKDNCIKELKNNE